MSARPNVLFMIADDHRFSGMGHVGREAVRTPALDALAARGTAFSKAYIMGGLSGAVCIPSRTSVHTGASVFRAAGDVDDIASPQNYGRLNDGYSTRARTFREEGYHTFATGKWHNDKKSFADGFCSGANIFLGGMSDHLAVPLHDFDPTGEYPQSAQYTGDGFSTNLFTDAAIDFLDGHDTDDPFFLYLAFTSPHDPRMAPEEYAAMYDPADVELPPNFMAEHPFDNGEMRIRDEDLAAYPRTEEEVRQHIADYYAMITHQDAHIARVLDALDRNGHGENTIIVYTADHGLGVGQHGLLGKQNVYDHSVRVPMIVAGPGVQAGSTVDEIVCLYDAFPTVCELTDTPIPDSVESRSFAGLATGATDTGRDSAFSVYRDIHRMVTDGDWKLIRHYRVHDRDKGEDRVHLFHVADDPWELSDLSGDPACAGKLRELADTMTVWMREVGDPFASTPVLLSDSGA